MNQATIQSAAVKLCQLRGLDPDGTAAGSPKGKKRIRNVQVAAHDVASHFAITICIQEALQEAVPPDSPEPSDPSLVSEN
jgi:hypothetical protein